MLIAAVAQIIQGVIIAALALTLPLAPFACAILAGDLGYLRRYFTTIARCARMTREMARADVLARRIEIELSPRAAAPADVVTGACTHCGKCCIHQSCVYLERDEAGQSRCAIYNNWFWRKTSCGSYPISAQEIAVYDCPSFTAAPAPVSPQSRVVIPIKRIAVAQADAANAPARRKKSRGQ
jgi:hypothetical protein